MLLICTASSGHNRTLTMRLAEVASTLDMPTSVLDLTA